MHVSNFVTKKTFAIHHSIDNEPNDRDFPTEMHHYCELYYFVSGSGYFTVEGNQYPLVPGSVLIIRQNESHKVHIDPSVPYERMVVHFMPHSLPVTSPDMEKLFYDRPLGKNNLIECSESSRKFIFMCMQRICSARHTENEFDKIVSYLLPIFSELAKESSQKAKPEAPKNELEVVAKIIEYINEHIADIKSLDDLEANFYFSKSYLNRIFKEKTGTSLWNFVTAKRLLKAQTEIMAGTPITVAAAKSGFSDYSSFYRQYKNKFGKEPRAEQKAVRTKFYKKEFDVDEELEGPENLE